MSFQEKPLKLWLLWPQLFIWCSLKQHNILLHTKLTCALIPYAFMSWYQKAASSSCNNFNFQRTDSPSFVLGGSQGSRALNSLITKWLEQHPALHYRVQIIHQVGDSNAVGLQKEWYLERTIPSFVFAYSNHVAPLYQVDLVLTRAGAGTLAELQFFKKKAIIVPLETSVTNHQLHNANAVAQLHPELFTVIRQQEIDKNFDLLSQLLTATITAKPYISPDCSCSAHAGSH